MSKRIVKRATSQLRADNHALRLMLQEAKLRAANAMQIVEEMWNHNSREHHAAQSVKRQLEGIPGVRAIVDARERQAAIEEEEWNRAVAEKPTAGGRR